MRRSRLFQALVAGFVLSSSAIFATADERPNFLFIIAEDMSPNLGCYGDPDAVTPNLDALAGRSIRYTRAFSATGVCATSRSAMISGMHPPSIGTQRMRSKMVLPETIRPFPAMLREAGYFCNSSPRRRKRKETSTTVGSPNTS